jgi:lipopolysaccharide heptosyltransferase I
MTVLNFTSPPQRILIIKPSAIGDIVHALPVLAALRKRWPDSHISWLIGAAYADLLAEHPLLDELICFQRHQFAQSWRNRGAAVGLFRFLYDMHKRQFDLVIDLQGLFRSAVLARITRCDVRIGFANARELGFVFYSHRIPIESMDQHAVDRYLKVAAALGCDTSQVEFPLVVGEQDRQSIAALLGDDRPYAVLLPGSNWATKRWPVERFGQLVGPLRERFGLRTVVAGGREDEQLGNSIPGAVNLVGRTTLRQLVGLLQRAELVIANDSGPMHIAAALGRPLLALFGPTNPIRTGPYRRGDCVLRLDLPCIPCYRRKCSHQNCLIGLQIEPVLALAHKQLAPVGNLPASVPS